MSILSLTHVHVRELFDVLQAYAYLILNIMFHRSRFWWSLLVGVDWWDAVGCTQSAAEDGIGKKA